MKRFLLALMLMLMVAFSTSGIAYASTEIYYPASMCIPVTAEDFDGGGSNGLTLAHDEGFGWANDAATTPRTLKCPVPYEHDPSDPRAVAVRVHVNDENPDPETGK